jgi:hypothetical protein
VVLLNSAIVQSARPEALEKILRGRVARRITASLTGPVWLRSVNATPTHSAANIHGIDPALPGFKRDPTKRTR